MALSVIAVSQLGHRGQILRAVQTSSFALSFSGGDHQSSDRKASSRLA